MSLPNWERNGWLTRHQTSSNEVRDLLSKGVLLADEVGLGKTIEAGIVLCQFWAERKRRLLVICPASLRKRWALELQEKFNLPALVLDAKAYREMKRASQAPLASAAVLVMSFHFANSVRDELKAMAWDLVVIDEAHKLRNAYRPSNKVGTASAGPRKTVASFSSRQRRCRTRSSSCTVSQP